MNIKEKHKPLNADQWETQKEALRFFIQNKIKELGIDGDLCVPDFVLATAMIESMKTASTVYFLGRQVEKGRG